MNSFILVSKDAIQQEEYLNKFVAKHMISPFDVVRIEQENSIGIEIVRDLQQTLFVKPYKGKEKIIVINHAERLTPEAQNALLKVLEEPPLYVMIFLCTTTAEVFLPTVVSRCKVIHLERKNQPVLAEENKKINADTIVIIQKGTIVEKLVLAEKLASDKENLARWFENIMLSFSEKLYKDIDDKEKCLEYSRILTVLQEGYKIFSTTNVSPRTILEHIFLTIGQ